MCTFCTCAKCVVTLHVCSRSVRVYRTNMYQIHNTRERCATCALAQCHVAQLVQLTKCSGLYVHNVYVRHVPYTWCTRTEPHNCIAITDHKRVARSPGAPRNRVHGAPSRNAEGSGCCEQLSAFCAATAAAATARQHLRGFCQSDEPNRNRDRFTQGVSATISILATD